MFKVLNRVSTSSRQLLNHYNHYNQYSAREWHCCSDDPTEYKATGCVALTSLNGMSDCRSGTDRADCSGYEDGNDRQEPAASSSQTFRETDERLMTASVCGDVRHRHVVGRCGARVKRGHRSALCWRWKRFITRCHLWSRLHGSSRSPRATFFIGHDVRDEWL